MGYPNMLSYCQYKMGQIPENTWKSWDAFFGTPGIFCTNDLTQFLRSYDIWQYSHCVYQCSAQRISHLFLYSLFMYFIEFEISIILIQIRFHSLKSRYLMSSGMFAWWSLFDNFLSQTDFFLKWYFLTTFLARLFRLDGVVWVRICICLDNWNGSSLTRETPNMH